MHEEERQRQQRRDKDLAVVSWRNETGDVAAHFVRESTDQRAEKSEPDRLAQKQIREATGEKDMQRHAPRHRSVCRHDHPQQKRRIENIAVHRGYVRQSAKQIRVPQWEPVAVTQRLRRKIAEGVAGDVLVAVLVQQRHPAQRGIAEHQRADCQDQHGEQCLAP